MSAARTLIVLARSFVDAEAFASFYASAYDVTVGDASYTTMDGIADCYEPKIALAFEALTAAFELSRDS